MSSPQQPLSDQAAAAAKCPFCGRAGLKSLGRHLPRCPERDGRDYSIYLAAKTISKKTAASHKFCPKCHKRFRRLDTHLRVSATCKEIPPRSPPLAVEQSNHSQDGKNPSAILNVTPPVCLDFTPPATLNFTPPDCHKARVKLPPQHRQSGRMQTPTLHKYWSPKCLLRPPQTPKTPGSPMESMTSWPVSMAQESSIPKGEEGKRN